MINIEKLRDYLQCDDAFLVEVIDNFLTESKEMIEQLKTGAAKADHEKMRAAAHKMLSSTRILGLNELTEKLEKIQSKSDDQAAIDDIKPTVDAVLINYEDAKAGLEKVKKDLM